MYRTLAEETAPELRESRLAAFDRMSESEIVSVKYEELCVGRIAETLGDFVGLGGEVQDEKQRYCA